MKKFLILLFSMALTGNVQADNVSDSDQLLCAIHQSVVCAYGVECHAFSPIDIDVPQFVVLDTRARKVSTTKGSPFQGESELEQFSREGGLITGQGREGERVFSVVIDEATGILTASSATDGFTISSFGSCTDANVDS